MIEVFESLKSTQILYAKNAIDLKEAIAKKYPHYSSKHTAELFAAAVHRIVDKSIFHFDRSAQAQIKHVLLQKVIAKDTFGINAYDIFEACTSLEVSDELYFEALTAWLNHHQPLCLTKNQVTDLILRLKDGQALSENTYSDTVHSPTLVSESMTEYTPKHLQWSNAALVLGRFKTQSKLLLTAFGLMVVMGFLALAFYPSESFSDDFSDTHSYDKSAESVAPLMPQAELAISDLDSPLQSHLQYKEVDVESLRNWLNTRDSMLASEPYFSSIISTAKEFNINPLLMFAITGQEQGFVAKSHKHAVKMANNPFNVYGSWTDFNTDISDTSKIAARTIINLSKECPEGENQIKWINRKYAEDPNWHIGVSKIFASLERIAGH